MTAPADLAEVLAALAMVAQATPGPWRTFGRWPHLAVVSGSDRPRIVASLSSASDDVDDTPRDAAAIVALRNAAGSIAALVDEVEALRAAIARRETAASPPTDAPAPCAHLDRAHDGSCFGCGRGEDNTNPEATP